MDQRIAELFQSSLLQENERTITSLQEEVIKQKAEILKLEQQISSKKQEFESDTPHFANDSQTKISFRNKCMQCK